MAEPPYTEEDLARRRARRLTLGNEEALKQLEARRSSFRVASVRKISGRQRSIKDDESVEAGGKRYANRDEDSPEKGSQFPLNENEDTPTRMEDKEFGLKNDQDDKSDRQNNEEKKNIIGESIHLGSTDDKLDTDFLYYLCQVSEQLRGLSSEHDKSLSLAWLDVLLGEFYVKEQSKRNRNIFLSQLLLAMMDDNVQGNEVFSISPKDQRISVKDAPQVFGLDAPKQNDCVFKVEEGIDNSLDVNEFSHMSEDKRTFIATKTTEGGIMAYIGVSVGDQVPLWISAKGETRMVPETRSIKVKEPSKKTIFETGGVEQTIKKLRKHFSPDPEQSTKQKIIKSMLTMRKPIIERKGVIDFYQDLINLVKEDIAFIEKTGMFPQNYDPPITSLLKQLEVELHHDNCMNLTGLTPVQKQYKLLRTLLRTLDIKVKLIEERSRLLDDTGLYQPAEEHNPFDFVNVTCHLPLETSDSVWIKTVEHKFSNINLKKLNTIYPSSLTKMLLILAEGERMSILLQEMSRHNTILTDMKQEFMNHVTTSVKAVKVI